MNPERKAQARPITIDEAMRAVSEEYDRECRRAGNDPAWHALMRDCLHAESAEIDRELPGWVAEIAGGMGVKTGTRLPAYVYQVARMAFRQGMRVQRKLDQPAEPTSMFWRSDRPRT